MDQGIEPEPKSTKRSKVGFPCYKCEYVATRAYYLRIHVENIHEEVRYPCSQCEYIAANTSNLRKHRAQ